MVTKPEALRDRSKQFAVSVVKFFRLLPRTEEGRVIGKQLLRSATSVAANYRAAGRSRSRAEFISKISTVVEEADETVFWIEMLIDAEIVRKKEIETLLVEANELLAIFAASQRTAKANRS
ncbi:MAG: four helix bundle protein [Ignavibacteriales bacterium]|nr:four helix bundle protein [Ignavibacteriales bacterium]